jgi:predicted DNA-binding protein
MKTKKQIAITIDIEVNKKVEKEMKQTRENKSNFINRILELYVNDCFDLNEKVLDVYALKKVLREKRK